jgi:hypothetical protein
MARDPRPYQRKQLRQMLHSAGSKANLLRWVELVAREPEGKPGAPPRDDAKLVELFTNRDTVKVSYSTAPSPRAALLLNIEGLEGDMNPGEFERCFGTIDAVLRRLYRKLTNTLTDDQWQVIFWRATQVKLAEDAD